MGRRSPARLAVWLLAASGLLSGAAGAVLLFVPALAAPRGAWLGLSAEARLLFTPPAEVRALADSLSREVRVLRADSTRLARELAQRRPGDAYVVVDARDNVLLLRQGERILLETTCSAGSGRELVAGRRRWVFSTPRGVFRVTFKSHLPVWIKPDWAFYEEGEKPPAPGSPERFEEAVLGEYALGFGNGYMIHGTLYKRMLGKSVTHGCIRLDDEPLERVYNAARRGTPIYIF